MEKFAELMKNKKFWAVVLGTIGTLVALISQNCLGQ